MKIRTQTHKYNANSHSIKTVLGKALEGSICMYKTPLGNLVILREETYKKRTSFWGRLFRRNF